METKQPLHDTAAPAEGLCDRLATAMRQSGHAWRAALHDALETQGLTLLQWAVIELVSDRPGMSQIELARAVGVEGPSLVRVLDGLERQNWLHRRADADDRRVNRVYPAAEACERMRQAQAAIDVVHRRAVSRMSEGDRGEFVRLVNLVLQGLAGTP